MIKNPCGTRDHDSEYVFNRDKILKSFKSIVESVGAQKIETPVIELMSTVNNIYGEEFNKLVYSFDNKTSEPLLLRYDHTVPFVRYCVSNNIIKGRFYREGKVYRKDDPQPEKGRFREFYQFDYDIIGEDDEFYDIEILDTLKRCVQSVIKKRFVIRYNFRDDIYRILRESDVEEKDYLRVCSSLDKLDKKDWMEVSEELLSKNIKDDTVQKLKYKMENEDASKNIIEFNEKLKNIFGDSVFRYDKTLMRGLDYYTGLIFEVEIKDSKKGISIAGGGRYDGLMRRLGSRDIKCCGFSIGVDRIMMSIKDKNKYKPETDIYIASIGYDKEKLRLLYKIRNISNLKVMCSEKTDSKIKHQMKEMVRLNAKYVIILAKDEIDKKCIGLKNTELGKQITVSEEDLIKNINNLINLFN